MRLWKIGGTAAQCHRKRTEAVLKCANPRPSGRATTAKQGIKINRSRHDRAAAQQEMSHVISGGRGAGEPLTLLTGRLLAKWNEYQIM